jgi:hypothetical protein
MLSDQMDVEGFYYNTSIETANAFNNATNTIVRDIKIASLLIRLKFAGDAMIPFVLPAISHLLTTYDSTSVDYTIEIWDSKSTNADFPKAPCAIEDIQVRGEIKGFKSTRFETAYFTHASMLTVLDHESKKGIVCMADNSYIPAFELACPLRGILSWILRKNKIVMLHAAGVGTAEGSVLIGGNSGAGKSSTSLRCLAGGLNYFGDDICAISIQNGAPQIHSVYSSGKTLSNDLMKFPELLEYVHGHYDEEYEKEIFFFNTLVASKNNNNGHLKAIVIPYQNAELEIGFQKIPFARALSVICSSSRTLLPDGGNEIFQMLSAVIHHIPCYQFNLGNNPKLISESLTKFISQLKENNNDLGR